MRHPYRPVVIAGVAILATTTLAAAALASAPSPSHKTWTVSPGTGTISRAVAMAGDTIVLKAGTFRDSVLSDKTLTIRGAGWPKTTINPPATSTNPCTRQGSMEGPLCAVGAFDSRGNPDPTKPVKNVSTSRLLVTGFTDGVLGLNTTGLMVSGVRSDHNTG